MKQEGRGASPLPLSVDSKPAYSHIEPQDWEAQQINPKASTPEDFLLRGVSVFHSVERSRRSRGRTWLPSIWPVLPEVVRLCQKYTTVCMINASQMATIGPIE